MKTSFFTFPKTFGAVALAAAAVLADAASERGKTEA